MRIGRLSPPGPYIAKLQAAGFRALPVPMQRRSLHPLRELALLNPLRRLYAQERPDLARVPAPSRSRH